MKYSTNLAENRKPKVDGNFKSESNSVDGDELSAKEYDHLVENYTEDDLEELFLENYDIDLSNYEDSGDEDLKTV